MKKNRKKRRRTRLYWLPPKNFADFFFREADDAYKAAHPVGYFFIVLLGIAALLLPAVLFGLCVQTDSGWVGLGYVGGFIFGIGLFNYIAAILEQFLGHLVSVIAFVLGGVMMVVSRVLCG